MMEEEYWHGWDWFKTQSVEINEEELLLTPNITEDSEKLIRYFINKYWNKAIDPSESCNKLWHAEGQRSIIRSMINLLNNRSNANHES